MRGVFIAALLVAHGAWAGVWGDEPPPNPLEDAAHLVRDAKDAAVAAVRTQFEHRLDEQIDQSLNNALPGEVNCLRGGECPHVKDLLAEFETEEAQGLSENWVTAKRGVYLVLLARERESRRPVIDLSRRRMNVQQVVRVEDHPAVPAAPVPAPPPVNETEARALTRFSQEIQESNECAAIFFRLRLGLHPKGRSASRPCSAEEELHEQLYRVAEAKLVDEPAAVQRFLTAQKRIFPELSGVTEFLAYTRLHAALCRGDRMSAQNGAAAVATFAPVSDAPSQDVAKAIRLLASHKRLTTDDVRGELNCPYPY